MRFLKRLGSWFCKKENGDEKKAWNQRERDCGETSIANDTGYAVQLANQYYGMMCSHGIEIKNARILEIGPGHNYGTMVSLACLGCKVHVADRFTVPWSQNYHSRFYRSLAQQLLQIWPHVDLSPIDKILGQGSHLPVVGIFQVSAEKIQNVVSEPFEVLFSNAVLEHLYDPMSGMRSLYNVACNGGYGFHQVDFRDHRDFSRPLDHLFLSGEEFGRIFEEQMGECGNQMRANELSRYLEDAGFNIIEFNPNMFADDEYLVEFTMKLKEIQSPYNKLNTSDLRILSAHYVVRKPGQVSVWNSRSI